MRRARRSHKLVSTTTAVMLLAATVGTTAVGLGASAPAMGADGVQIRYTEHGIPHIKASTVKGLGEGMGYASATANICTLADSYLTASARRSQYFGPDKTVKVSINANPVSNLASDFHFQRVNDSGIIDSIMAKPAPIGPLPEIRQVIAGYASGYNRYLASVGGSGGIKDPACRGAKWVRPITTNDVLRHIYSVIGQGSSTFVDGMSNAQPPGVSGGSSAKAKAPSDAGERIAAKFKAQDARGIGSNALAAGSDGVSTGKSALLANPHFPWTGSTRFWQAQLTVPGVLNASGVSLLGMPGTNIGHNDNVAWSHTVSTARPLGLFEVPLVPGQPTKYFVGTKIEKMTSRTVTVPVRQDDGSIKKVSRTLWSTRYGPVLNSVMGVPLPWALTAHVMRDANANNLRALNTWFGLMRAKSGTDAIATLKRTQGVPWVNTVIADRSGGATFANIQVVPNVSDDQAAKCSTLIGKVTFPVAGLTILDGRRAECAWANDPDAVEPGLMGPSKQPLLTRKDWVANGNDSPWLTNPAEPLKYPKVIGNTNSARSTRTQELILTAQRRLAGTDGLPGKGFSGETMKRLLFTDHSRVADLAAKDTAKMCSAFAGGRAPKSGGTIDVRPACSALASWNHNFSLDSRGSLLFQRFWEKVGIGLGGIELIGPWKVPFDPQDPVNTPNTLAIDRPNIKLAFGNAAAELAAAGIPLDAPLSRGQAVTRNGVRIPMHGSKHALGVLNVIDPTWNEKSGNAEIGFGSSSIQVTSFGDGPPKVSTLLTYSQSADPTSPYYADQTKLFSAGKWITERYTEKDILASPALRTVSLPTTGQG